jgi:hypothetical protein
MQSNSLAHGEMGRIKGVAMLEAPLHGKLPVATVTIEAVHQGEPAGRQVQGVAALAPLKADIVGLIAVNVIRLMGYRRA